MKPFFVGVLGTVAAFGLEALAHWSASGSVPAARQGPVELSDLPLNRSCDGAALEDARARIRTEMSGVTLGLRRRDWWSRRVPPPESLLARQARGLPHNPVAG